MKESDELDKLLQSKMEHYRVLPTPGRKAIFLEEGSKLLSKQNFWANRIARLMIVLLFLLGVGGITYLALITDQNESDKSILANDLPSVLEQMETTFQDSHSTDIALSSLPAQSVVNNSTKTINKGNTLLKSNLPTLADAEISAPMTSENEVIYSEQQFTVPNSITTNSKNSIPEDSILQIKSMESDLSADTVQQIEVSGKPQNEKTRNTHFRYDLYYQPEVIFNVIDSKKFINSFGAEVQFRFFNNRYLVLTGVGFSISQGYYEYIIDYQEYLGSYNKLDSVTFSLASDKFHLNPTKFYSEEDVFDTAVTNYATKYYKKFSYLQFPFIMGYDFIQKNKFSVGVRIGPSLSLLLNNKATEVSYDPGKNKIIQINQITPDRMKVNWQFVAGLNTTFYSGNHLFFEIEPRFIYYFNSVYQQSNSSNPPYSVGLRVAIGIK